MSACRRLIKRYLHVFISLSFFIFLLFGNPVIAQNQKPNIIFILGDDIGYKIPAANGGKSYSTPNLDNMAKQGMSFTQCHSAPLCSPSRFLLLTGKYNFRNYTTWGVLDTAQKTIGNMLKDAGYQTACFGKWQLSGGSTSVLKFGFDSYCIWDAFEPNDHGSRYKNPLLYTNNGYIPDSLITNKYAEDIFTDSVINFISRNKHQPFFVFYPMVLAHPPFQPTPDDSTAYAGWNYLNKSDTSFFPSMIKYMDKKIGMILNKVKQLGLDNNTVIIYTGDNGTPFQISEYVDNDSLIIGGKKSTTENGILVPMMIDWKGTITPGSVNNDLIHFTDFLPTLAHIANIAVPSNYGALDGIDFMPRLKGQAGTPRDWLFYDYDAYPGIDSLRRWAQTKKYKLYDTSLYNAGRLFFNIKEDAAELHPLSHSSLTPDEIAIKQQLLKVINGYVHEGTPILGPADVINISDSSALLEDSVQVNGGSTIKLIGAVWSIEPDPVISSSNYTSDGTISGPFQTYITGLTANTTYYVRAYAKNIAGVSYSNEIKFRTLLHSPIAFTPTSISNEGFTAHWSPVSAATNYKLYISKDSTFTKIKPSKLFQQFNTGINPPSGWTFSGSISENDSIYNTQSPSLQLRDSGAQITAERLGGPATQLQFWIQGLKTDNLSSLLVEGFDGNTWTLIKSIDHLPSSGTIITFNSISDPTLNKNFIQFRFTYSKSKGTLVFDDVSIKYNDIIPSFVQGFNGLKVSNTSFKVTGLNAATKYYYRIKAINSYNHSGSSNVVSLVTCTSGICNGLTATNNALETENNFKADVFPNPTLNGFTVNIRSTTNKQTEIIVTDAYGKKVYQSCGSNIYTFGNELNPGMYFVKLVQGEKSKTFKLIKGK